MLAAQIGSAASAHVAREHTLEGAAQGYMRFLAERYGWRPDLAESREPGISNTASHPQPRFSTQSRDGTLFDRFQLALSRFMGEAWPGRGVRPQVSNTPGTNASPHPLTARVGDALVEIGATERDTALIASAACAVSELVDQ